MEKWLITGIGQRIYEVILKYFLVPEIRKCSKDEQCPIKDKICPITQEPTERNPNSQSRNDLNSKYSSIRL